MEKYIILSLIFVIIIIVTNIRSMNLIRDLESKYKMQSDVIKDLKALNNSIRSQRHDFLNHIQVIHSLMEMKEYDETANYLERLYGDIEQLNNFLKTKNPAINALLQAKSNDATNRNFLLKLDIKSKLDNLSMPSWELCRCLGNLIDNSIYEAIDSKDKTIQVSIAENIKEYIISVSNTGKAILKEDLEKIFEANYTTKANKGEGMGLYIINNIIKKYNSQIVVESDSERTTFTISIPKEIEN